MSHVLRDSLLRQLDISWALAEYHLTLLSTEECLQRPANKGLHVHQRDGAWIADWPEHEGYDLGPPSIAWITWHMVFWWSSVIDHSFGPGTVTRETIAWPGTAEEVRARLLALHAEWRERIGLLSDDELADASRTRWPFSGRPFSDVVTWLNIELAKNAAEIGYARFLFAVR